MENNEKEQAEVKRNLIRRENKKMSYEDAEKELMKRDDLKKGIKYKDLFEKEIEHTIIDILILPFHDTDFFHYKNTYCRLGFVKADEKLKQEKVSCQIVCKIGECNGSSIFKTESVNYVDRCLSSLK